VLLLSYLQAPFTSLNRMSPILVEPLSEKAYELLQQLEALNILRVVKPEAEAPTPPVPRKWAGSIPATSAEAWDKHLQEIRGEWERDI
jgi:hypothetical protein